MRELRISISSFIRENFASIYWVAQAFHSYHDCLRHCEQLVNYTYYTDYSIPFKPIDLQVATMIMNAHIYVYRLAPPIDKTEYNETAGKGEFKAVPHYEFHPFVTNDKTQTLRLLFIHDYRKTPFKRVLTHCEAIITMEGFERYREKTTVENPIVKNDGKGSAKGRRR